MVINVYKEKDWTSFDVVAKLKGALGGKKNRKVGHAGTLDPLAEGVLLVLTDDSTKDQDIFMVLDKEYVCDIIFGAETQTFDMEGDLAFNEIPHDFDLASELHKLLPKYIGEIQQKVPAFSAVKVNGKKLYIEARKGKVDILELPVKKVTIFSIEILETNYTELSGKRLPQAKLKVVCSKGTYIRSLANDLGKDLNTGAVLFNLVRTRVGDYKIDNSIKIGELLSRLEHFRH